MRRPALVAGGLTMLVALSPPMDDRAAGSLTAHMVQHVLLLAVASPLLALGLPLPRVRGPWVAIAAAATVVQSTVMWGWHAPVLFEAALRHPPLHGVEHISFLVTSTAFWWVMLSGRRDLYGPAVLGVFVAALPGTALGAALLFAPRPWYSGYSLSDQQMAGVVMWSVGGLVYVVAAAVLFGLWLSSAEAATR